MNVNELYDSKYLKKEDLKGPVVATIANVSTDMLREQNGGQKKKGILHFNGGQLKSMILNVGNLKALTNIYGSETSNWIGKPIEVWVNPNVEMGGEMVGGLRLRLPQNAQQNGQATKPSLMNMAMAEAALAPLNLTRADLIRCIQTKYPDANRFEPARDTPMVHDMIREAEENMKSGSAFDEFSSGEDF